MPGQNQYKIDYDGKPVDLVKQAFRCSYDRQKPRLKQWRHAYQVMNGFLDMTGRDPDLIQVFLPKIRQVVLSKWPRDVKAICGARPYFPFSTERREFKSWMRVQESVVDHLVHKGHYWKHTAMALLLKIVYGFGAMDVTPYLEDDVDPAMLPSPMGPQFVEMPVKRLRLRFRSWAPWELFPHPGARGCEEKGECQYLVKVEAVSKRSIIKLAEQGGYPGLDIEKLYWTGGKPSSGISDLEGQAMLRSIGLRPPDADEDTCILKRFESEDRYTDVVNDWIDLRDVATKDVQPSGRVNLARCLQMFDPHTENQFFGVGEVQPNEIIQDLLNDMTAQALNAHEQVNKPTVVHDSKVPASKLVKGLGRRWGIDLAQGEDIRSKIMELRGSGLPPDHYLFMDRLENWIDKGTNNYPGFRGESADKDQTASEAFLLDENASSTQEVQVRMAEELFLHSLGDLVVSTVTRRAKIADMIEIVGQEQVMPALIAALQAGVPPTRLAAVDLPGRFNFDFKGSDKVANLLLRQRNFKVLFDMLKANGNVSPELLSREAIKLWEFNSPEWEAAVVPDQVMMMMQMVQAEAEAERQIAVRGAQPGPAKQIQGPRGAVQQQMREVRQTA